MTMAMIFRDFPNDLIEEEILCYVPATYLKRLKSTCKQWLRLIDGDSRFARKHTYKAPKQFLVLLLKEFGICTNIFNLHGSLQFISEVSLVDPQSKDSAQFGIARVFHCDGLLLCTPKDRDESRLVVWNPFTGETRWFLGVRGRDFALRYYREDNDKSYKILSFFYFRNHYAIYEFSYDSWRTLHDIMPPGWIFIDFDLGLSLKGNTYWLVRDAQYNMSLFKFDFQTEKSVLLPLPYQYPLFDSRGLSVVRDEKFSVLIQLDKTTEIWVTNKIDETTQVVSWSKVLALDMCPDLEFLSHDVNFLLDEEKKVVMMCVTCLDKEKNMIYTVGEDDEVTQVGLGTYDRRRIWIHNYVPSLVQIKQGGRKKKRGGL